MQIPVQTLTSAETYYWQGSDFLAKGAHLDAALAFWSSALLFRFRKEPLLMCGRALHLAALYLESCAVFELVPVNEMDDESALFYAASLRFEGRVREAQEVMPYFASRDDRDAQLVRAQILHDMGRCAEARPYFEALLAEDRVGHCYDRLFSIYLASRERALLRNLLFLAQKNLDRADYYAIKLAAFDILAGQHVDIEPFRTNDRFDIIEAAQYLYHRTNGDLILTGTTLQTFDSVRPYVLPDGVICEFGVRHGHAITFLAELFPERRIWGFDSFEGLPEAWHHEPAGSYSTGGRLPKVPSNVKLVAGWFDKTLPEFVKTLAEPLALLNIDCDIYSSTKTIFELLGPRIIPGTIIVFDEYICNPQWQEDEYKAFQEWVTANRVRYKYVAASLYTKQVAVKIESVGNY